MVERQGGADTIRILAERQLTIFIIGLNEDTVFFEAVEYTFDL